MCPPRSGADAVPYRDTARSAHNNGIASAYCDTCPNAHFCAYSDTRAYRYPDSDTAHNNGIASAYCDTRAYLYPYPDTHAYLYPCPDSDTYASSHAYAAPHAYPYSDACADPHSDATTIA